MLTRTRTRGSMGTTNPKRVRKEYIDKKCTSMSLPDYGCEGPVVRSRVNDSSNTLVPCPDLCTISDDTTSPRHNYKEVSHDKWDSPTIVVPSGILQGTWSPWNEWQCVEEKLVGNTFKCFPNNYLLPVPDGAPAIDWHTLVSKVGSQLDAEMTTKSNILVTAAEALSTIAMVKQPLAPLKALFGSRRIRDVVARASDIHLTYKYGWKQLRNDIIAFSGMYNAVTDHLASLQDDVGTYRHLSATQVDDVTSGFDDIVQDFSNILVKHSFTLYRRKATFSCMSLIDAAIAHQSRAHATLKALGVTKMVEAAWDVVPFSFVVDWLVNWTRLSSDPRFQFEHHTTKFLGHSTLQEWSFKSSSEVTIGPIPGVDLQILKWQGGDHVVRRTFSRQAGFPAAMDNAGLFSTLSKTNLFDGAALILQRLK